MTTWRCQENEPWEILWDTWTQNIYETKFVSSTNSEKEKDEEEKEEEEEQGREEEKR